MRKINDRNKRNEGKVLFNVKDVVDIDIAYL